MKFVNRTILSIGLVSLLSGCVSNDGAPQVALALDKSKPIQLLDTAAYIPKRTLDEETGQLLPYQKAVNPYTALTGRIAAKHVQKFVQARQAFQISDFAVAKRLLEALTAEGTSLSGPWVMLGDIATQQREYDAAVTHYAKAIDVNDANVNAYVRLARIQRLRGDFVQAQNTYAKALSVWPDFPEAHLNLSILYDIYLNKPLQAQRHMESYQFLTGGKDKARAEWLAELQQRTGREVELKAEVTRAVSITSSRL